MSKQDTKVKLKQKIDTARAKEIVDKAISNGLHQASAVQLLSEAKSLTHLRGLIGSFQRGELGDTKE